MTTRRQILQWGTGAALAAASATATGPALAASGATPPKRLLILGGTGFIGPHLTQEALRLGWQVTHFNRGKRDADGVPGVETLLGDRKGQLDALRGRKWDALVDNTGYIPKYVKMSAELLAPAVGYCLFVSSISAYASFAKPNDETSATGQLADPAIETITNDSYGPMKALCEQYSLRAFKGRASIVRPGYIVGPLDPTDRFTYWPVRVARGGEMLAPGTSADPVQVIDVRDLAAWMMQLVEARTTGIYNAISLPGALTMGAIVRASELVSPDAGTRVTWVDEDFLGSIWKPEELDLPPWSPMKGEMAGASLTAGERARATGLKIRPIADTVRDTMEWFRTLPADRQSKLRAGLDPRKEADTLKAWHERAKAG
jgi:2'-hydroxyisoflavone reductase